MRSIAGLREAAADDMTQVFSKLFGGQIHGGTR